MQTFINQAKEKWTEVNQRPAVNNEKLAGIGSDILKDVKQNGDDTIKKYCLRFDKVQLDDLKVNEQEIAEAVSMVDDELKKAVQIAKANIEKFHLSQKDEIKKIETSNGVWCWRKAVAIERVGLYIPG